MDNNIYDSFNLIHNIFYNIFFIIQDEEQLKFPYLYLKGDIFWSNCNDDSSFNSITLPMEEGKTNYQTKEHNHIQNKKEDNEIKEKETIKEKKKEEDENIQENNNDNKFCSNFSKNFLRNKNQTNIIIKKAYTIVEIISIFEKNNNNNCLGQYINILKRNQNNVLTKINKHKHDKYSTDNIIKKIKVHLIKILIKYVNIEFISKVYKKFKLKILDYKFSSNINKEENLKCLDMTIKELLSLEITKKFITKSAKINEYMIKKMLRKEKNNEKVQYVFNLKFKEWIDIFTMKREGNIIIKIDGLDLLLNKILNKQKDGGIDEVYFVNFVYHLYNFENWFLCKQEKKRRNAKLETK